MKKGIVVIIILAAIVSIVIQFILFDGFDKNDIESLNINFLAGVISLMLTYLVIDRLLDKHDKKRKTTFINDSIKNEYISVLSTVSQYYISYVTKKPPTTSKDIDAYDKVISDILNNIDSYVDENFLRNGISVIQPKVENGWINPVEKTFSYQDFCEITKQTIRKVINEFFIKYNSLVPEEVIVNLSNIINYFMKPIFTTGLEQGIRIDLSNAQFEPKSFREPIKEIGNYILELYKYT